ncbi:AMP-binding protein [Mangrovihabitans endophyticus]|uniref:Amino acid adenylation domain-containing protein n=1 Tax=Mangrovihabitans endophyticus TaxID=1751298 RepID=A0A8J3BW33_9ACTN|nr:AMP-binding protein [Mangrovihabitans endophyticus]GGK72697.1 hypothetical protein GCM10012284_03190 [Mangrovihabitans endophyticus]
MTIEYTTALWGGEANPPCLIDAVVAAARRHPDRPALVTGESAFTYAQLMSWAASIADDLERAGSRAGELIGVACPRGAEAVAAMVAVLLSGRAYVPLDLDYPRLRLEHMLRDSGVGVVLHAGPELDLAVSAVTVPVRRPEVGEQVDSRSPRLWDWVAKHEPDLPGYVIYTSGSTGWPKGVLLQHRCLDNVVQWQAECSPAPDLRTAQFAPLNFDVSFQEIFGTLGGGGTVVVIPERLRRDPGEMLDWLAEQRVQRLFLPYVALQMVAVAAGNRESVADLTLVEINVAGEQLVCTEDIREFFRRLPTCRLVNHYGQSESAMVSYHILGPDPNDWPTMAPIGSPLPGCELLIDTDASGDGTGELLVAGMPVSLGYINQPELNRRRFIHVPATRHGHRQLFRTGDLVRFEEGHARYLTRMDEDVKLRGIRINLTEVEAQLLMLPEVASATVVLSAVPGRPRALRAAVVLRDPGYPFDEDRVREALDLVLPAVSVPLSIVALERMPRTPSGKVDRDAVAQVIEDALSIGPSL